MLIGETVKFIVLESLAVLIVFLGWRILRKKK